MEFGANSGPAISDNSAAGNCSASKPPIILTSTVGINGAVLVSQRLGCQCWLTPGSIAAVPDAESYALTLAGLAALAFFPRRRKASFDEQTVAG